jgi:hypothetical protein
MLCCKLTSQFKSHGIGVSAAAANAEAMSRLKKALEAEKEKHDEQKMMERWAAGQMVSS